MAIRAGAGAAAALVVGGGIALALHSSSPAQAVPDPASSIPTADASTSPSESTSALVDSAGHSVAGASSAPLPAGRNVLVLGDSLGLDIYPWLADLLPDRYVSYNAVVGRDTPTTLVALRQMSAQDVPPVVLVSLGTNDLDAGSFRQAAESILTTLGPDRCVVWSDVVRPDSIGSATPINDVIDELATNHSNVHVFRWSALVAAHPDWLSGDGIHPGEVGAQARAQAFADAALACSPLDASAPKASQEYLPPSAFDGPGGTSVQGGTYATPTPTPTPIRSHSAKPHPTSSPSRSATSSPTHSSSPTSSASKDTSAPPASSTAPTVTPSDSPQNSTQPPASSSP
jgi:lysophospholipase L1-like esterase